MQETQMDIEKFHKLFHQGSMKPDAGILNLRNFELHAFCTIASSKLREISEFFRELEYLGEKTFRWWKSRKISGNMESRRRGKPILLATSTRIFRKSRKRKLHRRRNFPENKIAKEESFSTRRISSDTKEIECLTHTETPFARIRENIVELVVDLYLVDLHDGNDRTVHM